MIHLRPGWKHGYLQRFAVHLRELREAAGLSRDELASRAGTNRGHIRKLEAGTHAPRPEMVERLATALGVEPDDLVPSESFPEPTDPSPPGPKSRW